MIATVETPAAEIDWIEPTPDTCWECGTPVPALQLEHTRRTFKADICDQCEPFVHSVFSRTKEVLL